ncbi:MAG TPA: PKD domain-containing protein [Methanosarcina sp.]
MPTALAEGNVKITDFSSNVTNGTVILNTRFTGNVTGNITDWRYTFQNVETGAATYSGGKTNGNITTHHDIKKPGVYNVTLAVWGPEGNDSLTKVAYVTANEGNSNTPVADFTASSTYGNAPLNVSFTDNSTDATSWYWKFGDGNISKERNPTHNYSKEGNYTAILVVNNANGWSAKTQEITVQNGLPVVDFSADNSSGSVQFTDSSQNATEWNWDFGDGETSTDENPTHTYSAAGNYTVTLTASNEMGSASKVSIVNLTEENIANDNSGSSSSSSSSSSSHHRSIVLSNLNASLGNQSNVTEVVNETANVTEAVNETQGPNTQGLEGNSSTATSAEQTPEQTQSANTSSSNTSENGGKKTPGFEMIYGIAGILGMSLYRRR